VSAGGLVRSPARTAGGRLKQWTRRIRPVDQGAVGGGRPQGSCRGVQGAGGCSCDSGSGPKGKPGFLGFDLVSLLVMYVNVLGLIL